MKLPRQFGNMINFRLQGLILKRNVAK